MVRALFRTTCTCSSSSLAVSSSAASSSFAASNRFGGTESPFELVLLQDLSGSMALDGVSFALQPGVFGLLGPNGAGKSTLIKALMGLVRLSGGKARALGLDSRADYRRVRELVGYMPEDDCIFPGLKGVEFAPRHASRWRIGMLFET